MRTRFLILFVVLTMWLAACQPAAPIQEPTPTPPRVPVSSDGQTLGSNAPEIVWDADPGTLVISGTFCCGFTTPLVPLNYIPDFQVWGDGRYVWVVYGSDSPSRQVLQGQFTEEQLATFLQKAVDAGFFGWEDRYENYLVADMADQCMSIHLESASKTVCEYAEGAPDAFHALYDMLARGNGIEGTDFIPERGYLLAYAYPREVLRPISENDILWPTDKLFPLADAVETGAWVEGDALLLAWQTVNADPWNSTIRDAEGFYNLTLQIPGLSMNQPPAEMP